jgi:hypothetical protein
MALAHFATRRKCTAFIFRPGPLRSAPDTPCHLVRASTGLSESCQQTQTCRSLLSLQWQPWCRRQAQQPLQIELRSVRMPLSTPHPGRVRTLSGARSDSSKAAKMKVCSMLHRTLVTRLLQGAAAGAVVTMIFGFNWAGGLGLHPLQGKVPTLPLTEA